MAKSSVRPNRRRPRTQGPQTRRRARAQTTDREQHAIEQALAAFAHDIRTPLTGIVALSELLATSDLGERERRWVASLKDSAEHIVALTTLAVDAAKARVAGFVPRRERFNARALADAVAGSCAARAEAKGLTARVTMAGDMPNAVIGDPIRLRAALENLIDNAVKFTERGEISLEMSHAKARDGRIRLVFAVSDSGIGMSPAEIKRLFRPFAQANKSIAETYGGAGLGLALVKRLAEAMGGGLKVMSKPGRGSTFTLSVVVAADMASEAPSAPTSASHAAAAPGLRILCVEDNPYGRVILKTILSELGHRADFVGTGEAAVEAVARGGYDAVLMDLTLPGMDGLEATRRIRALAAPASQVTVIGVSGRSGADEEARARAAGMDGYLEKPIGPRALTRVLAAAPSQT